MKEIQQNESAEHPIEILGYVLFVILVMSIVSISIGTLSDSIMYQIDLLPFELSPWGTQIMSHARTWMKFTYYIPTIAIIIVMVWAVKMVIRKKEYTATGQYMNTEDEV